jgi:5'-nucleotidase
MRGFFVAAAIAAACALPAAAPAASRTVEVQLLALNDLHGHLEPLVGLRLGTTAAGGIEYLATHVRRRREQSRAARTFVVSAGDLVGGSPLLSSAFHDEPTIDAMNLLGLDFNAVGNHELDEGAEELLRLARGGCHPVDGCRDGDGFSGARFQMLAANTLWQDTAETLFAPYAIPWAGA